MCILTNHWWKLLLVQKLQPQDFQARVVSSDGLTERQGREDQNSSVTSVFLKHSSSLISGKMGLYNLCKSLLTLVIPSFGGLEFESMLIQLQWRREDKESRRLSPKPSRNDAWPKKWMDFKGIHYAKCNSDKFNVNMCIICVLSRYYHFICKSIVNWLSRHTL